MRRAKAEAVVKEARRLLEEISREDPELVERVLSRLGPEAYLVRYLLAKRRVGGRG